MSVVPDASSKIQGLIAKVPNDNWVELDAREVGYVRRVLNPEEWLPETSSLVIKNKPNDVQMYELRQK